MFIMPHASRIFMSETQFTNAVTNITDGLLECENLYAIAPIVTTDRVSASSSLELSFPWDDSLGVYRAGKGDKLQVGFLMFTGAKTNGVTVNGNTINGNSGGFIQCLDRGSTIATNGTTAAISADVSSLYFNWFSHTITSGRVSNTNPPVDFVYIEYAYFDDDGIVINFVNTDASDQDLDVMGYGYGFC